MKKLFCISIVFAAATLNAGCICNPTVTADYTKIRNKIQNYYANLQKAIKAMQDETDKLIVQQYKENLAVNQALKNYMVAYLKTFEDSKIQSDIKNLEGLNINYKGLELKKIHTKNDIILSKQKILNSNFIDRSIKKEIDEQIQISR